MDMIESVSTRVKLRDSKTKTPASAAFIFGEKLSI